MTGMDKLKRMDNIYSQTFLDLRDIKGLVTSFNGVFICENEERDAWKYVLNRVCSTKETLIDFISIFEKVLLYALNFIPLIQACNDFLRMHQTHLPYSMLMDSIPSELYDLKEIRMEITNVMKVLNYLDNDFLFIYVHT
jgi:hypothetical protein